MNTPQDAIIAYRQLATEQEILPPDDTVSVLLTISTSYIRSARSRLRSEGFEFEQISTGQWEVTKRPPEDTKADTYNNNGAVKVYYEKVSELPPNVAFGHARSKNKWQELHEALDQTDTGEIIRLHFDQMKLASLAQNASSNYPKKLKAAFTVRTRIVPADQGGYWLYIKKIKKDPSTWRVYKRSKK